VTLWAAIAGMAVITLALRASFILLPERLRLPALVRRALPFVPAAVLTAVWAPELALQKGVLHLSLNNERLLAGLVAIAVSWRYRLTFATIGTGLLALHFFEWLT
jgi:branched-subunit amino acid transport protein